MYLYNTDKYWPHFQWFIIGPQVIGVVLEAPEWNLEEAWRLATIVGKENLRILDY